MGQHLGGWGEADILADAEPEDTTETIAIHGSGAASISPRETPEASPNLSPLGTPRVATPAAPFGGPSREPFDMFAFQSVRPLSSVFADRVPKPKQLF